MFHITKFTLSLRILSYQSTNIRTEGIYTVAKTNYMGGQSSGSIIRKRTEFLKLTGDVSAVQLYTWRLTPKAQRHVPRLASIHK